MAELEHSITAEGELKTEEGRILYQNSKNTIQRAEYLTHLAKTGKLEKDELQKSLQEQYNLGRKDSLHDTLETLINESLKLDKEALGGSQLGKSVARGGIRSESARGTDSLIRLISEAYPNVGVKEFEDGEIRTFDK